MVVGTASDLILSPRSCSKGSLVLFKFSADCTKLEHVHTVSFYVVCETLITDQYETRFMQLCSSNSFIPTCVIYRLHLIMSL